ncbi:MAG: hypothetical protein OEW15_08635 [Nitrospirota bacterium]|nr:hypothetical protein [Nitrospirota bacterium]
MKAILNFFLSIRTAYWFFVFFAVIMLWGSIALPGNLAFFSGIDDTPLFRWLSEAGNIGTTWWIYGLIAGLGLFALNTLVCTGEALLFRVGRINTIARLSPQIMHVGVLFVMLGHLLTASMGMKLDLDIRQGETKLVAEGAAITLVSVREELDANGYAVDWEAVLRWSNGGKTGEVRSLRPAHPLHMGSYGIFSKSVNVDNKGSSALIRVSRDPGAPWALLGGVLLCLGGAGFVLARMNG